MNNKWARVAENINKHFLLISFAHKPASKWYTNSKEPTEEPTEGPEKTLVRPT